MPTQISHIQFRCAACKTGIRAPAAAAGRCGACPTCKRVLRIPGPAAPAAAPISRDNPARPADALEGTLVGGDFEVQSLVGTGSHSRVYRARQRSLNRIVALKILSGPDVNLRRLARLQVEALAMAQLSHPHILKVHSSGIDDGRGWMATEFAAGGSLADRMGAGAIPWPTAYRWFKQAILGLDAIHQAEVVHRDLKPANLMLTEGDSIKISDFGLTKLAGDQVSLTGEGRRVGTPAYLAPEQMLGEEVDGRADLYALGATFYHVFAGRLPFAAKTTQESMLMRLRENPAPLRTHAPHIPAEIADAVAALLHRSRKRRINAEELLGWLDPHEHEGRLPTV